MTNEEYMSLALDLAREAAEHGEVPVGCVIADAAGRVIGRGRNRREELGDATAHAEVEAIREAGAALGSWRLEGCTMYVTLEPCPMCTGAIINSRIPCLVFGARDAVTGSCGKLRAPSEGLCRCPRRRERGASESLLQGTALIEYYKTSGGQSCSVRRRFLIFGSFRRELLHIALAVAVVAEGRKAPVLKHEHIVLRARSA